MPPPSRSTRARSADADQPAVEAPLRKLVLAAWGAVALFAAFGFLGLNLGWEQRAIDRTEAGLRAYNGKQYTQARDAFTAALAENPRHAPAHFFLGRLNDEFLRDPARAVYHYDRYLDNPVSQDEATYAQARRAIQQQLVDGSVEDPMDAVRDLYAAARAEAPDAFGDRARPYAAKLAKVRRTVPDHVWAVWARDGYAAEPRFHSRIVRIGSARRAGELPRWSSDVRVDWSVNKPANARTRGQTLVLVRTDGLWQLDDQQRGM